MMKNIMQYNSAWLGMLSEQLQEKEPIIVIRQEIEDQKRKDTFKGAGWQRGEMPPAEENFQEKDLIQVRYFLLCSSTFIILREPQKT